MILCAKIIVSGFVQGVGYRYFAAENAKALGISGWVRNIAGGFVEIKAAGEKPDMDEFIARLKQGPLNSQVGEVDVTYIECADAGFDGFHITH